MPPYIPTARQEGSMTRHWVIFETRADIRHCMDRLEIEPWEEIALPAGYAVNIAGWLGVSETVILRQSVLETLNRLYQRGRDQVSGGRHVHH